MRREIMKNVRIVFSGLLDRIDALSLLTQTCQSRIQGARLTQRLKDEGEKKETKLISKKQMDYV